MKKSKEELKAELMQKLEALDQEDEAGGDLSQVYNMLDSINTKLMITFFVSIGCLSILLGLIIWVLIG